MSRVCVKNLPKYLTEDRLREQFSITGEVTDAKIVRTSDGKSRQFGFVGYRTEEDAQAAIKYFNQSFLDTCKLACEMALPIGDAGIPRPWSRHSQGSSAYTKTHEDGGEEEQAIGKESRKKAPQKKSKKDGLEEDPRYLEFLQVMQPRSKTKLWGDNTFEQGGKTKATSKDVDVAGILHPKKTLSSNNGNKTDSPIKTKTKTKKKGKNKEDSTVEKEDCGDQESLEAGEGMEKLGDSNRVDIAKNEAVSDLDYLKSRVKQDWSDEELERDSSIVTEEEASDQINEIEEDDESSEAESEEKDENEDEDELVKETPGHQSGNTLEVIAETQESVSETGRLFVRNLSYTTSEDDLAELFGKFGELSEVHLVVDKETKRSKGFAYILYMLPEAAIRAMETLDKSTLQGRLLHILPAKRPPPAPVKDMNNANSFAAGLGINKLKQAKEDERKAAEASGKTSAWNSLFMRQDTIAANVARKYGLSKSDFLDPEAGDLAVRMALGETHIIADTKKALHEEGVDVEKLEELVLTSGRSEKVKRSDRIILVKNLPYETLETDLIEMFGKFGSLERVILPPTRTLALVSFLEASEARAAFKGLAYKRFKHVPLYLEWCVDNILSKGKKKNVSLVQGEEKMVGMGKEVKQIAAVERHLHIDEDDSVDAEESRSIFVKNLNFKTSDKALWNHFEQHLKQGALRSVKIKTKPSKGSGGGAGKQLSMGFGFLELDSAEAAKEACKQLQGTILDGHALVLQVSHRKKEGDAIKSQSTAKADKNASSTKMIVRNVAFEATKRELRQLFTPFGQIKSLRVPKKFDGQHRGFAFVEFATKQEAENALSALSSTHLYGRHLVLECAKENESLEELRARTAAQFARGTTEESANPSKRRKLGALLDDADLRFDRIVQ